MATPNTQNHCQNSETNYNFWYWFSINISTFHTRGSEVIDDLNESRKTDND